MHCFGVTHHNPFQVLDFLHRNALVATRKEVLMASNGEMLPAKTKKRVIFILDTATASRNIKTLNSDNYGGLIVFVFGSTLKLREIEGCLPIDASDSDDPMAPVSKRKPLRIAALRASLKKPTSLSRKKKDYLRDMVSSVKKGSLLAPLMTFIYSLPSSTHQTPVKKACAEYFRRHQTVDALTRNIERDIGMPLSRLANARLKTILDSDAAARYRSFFGAYRPKMTAAEMEKLATATKTNLYEINYLLSVCDGTVKDTKKKTKAKR